MVNDADLYCEENKILLKLLEYMKYNYEEEKGRTNNIEKKAKLITLFLGGGVIALFSRLPIEKIQQLISHGSNAGFIIIAAFAVSFILLIIALLSG